LVSTALFSPDDAQAVGLDAKSIQACCKSLAHPDTRNTQAQWLIWLGVGSVEIRSLDQILVGANHQIAHRLSDE
jgi:hypothetical protein